MSRYPYMEYADGFLARSKDIYAPCTWNDIRRRYVRQSKILQSLKAEGKVSSTSPKHMTVEDVRVYLTYQKARGTSPSDITKDITYLRFLFDYCESKSVDACLRKYPLLLPRKKDPRLPPLSDDEYQRIVRASKEIDPEDWRSNRAYALVLIVLTSSTRTKEIRLCELKDLDTKYWILNIVRVKGEGSYGNIRKVPIPPDVRPLLLNYLRLRKKWVGDTGKDIAALFPSKDSEDGFLVANSLRKIRTLVEEDAGVKFDFRKLRRTYGQDLLDRDVKVETVSVLMGHSTTVTTEKYYARRKNDKAVEEVRKLWGFEPGEDKGGEKNRLDDEYECSDRDSNPSVGLERAE